MCARAWGQRGFNGIAKWRVAALRAGATGGAPFQAFFCTRGFHTRCYYELASFILRGKTRGVYVL
jgi:hypothetical protein